MFAKAYKLKSNTTLKNSEKKHLIQRIRDEFCSSTEEKVKELVPAKSNCISMKLVLHSGDMVNVYSVDNVPIIIEMEEKMLPTVCALWKVPDLVPLVIIHSPVLSKIQSGAPLYLPGVVTPAGGVGFPLFQSNAIISLCTHDNAGACVVGRALMSSADMLLKAGGVCLETLHVLGDQLCKDNRFTKIERPKMGCASYNDVADIVPEVSQLSLNQREEWPSLGKQPPVSLQSATHTRAPALSVTSVPGVPVHIVINEPKLIVDNEPTNLEEASEVDSSTVSEDLPQSEDIVIPDFDTDGLLRWCLLSFLKHHAKNHEYPFKTNLLYKFLMQLCPPDKSIDVKKSSYKKLGKFLEAMQQEGFLEVREVDKGVSAVTTVNVSHPAVRSHRVPASLRVVESTEPAQGDYVPPLVREMYCVTAVVLELFPSIKKGAPLTASEVRAHLTEYVKSRNLNSTEVKGGVTLDNTLAKLTGRCEGECTKWDILISSVQSRMTPSTEMRFSDGSVKLTKTKLEPIKMQVASRSGNKKVTLVSNLESFGFSLPALCHVCQTGVAASCSITRTPGSKFDQLMIQGDQTHFVAKLLIEKYGLPKKYVEGADKALNKKK